MPLDKIVPSVLPLKNSDTLELEAGKQRKRLTVLVGAGASMYAKAPSTIDLTRIIGERQISGSILKILLNNERTKDANFEDVLHVLEELDAFMFPRRALPL